MKGKSFEIGFVVVLWLFVLLIFLPPFGAPSAAHARQLRSQSQARSLVQASIVYAHDHGGWFPSAAQWPDALIELGIIQPELLVSGVEDGDGVSYIYLPLPGVWSEGEDENRIVIYEDPKHFEKGVVVGFSDARTEFVEHDEFERMLAEQLASEPQNPDPETP